MRPYSALDYAWDEPALPHKLIIALPGNRRLGVFNLDTVSSLLIAVDRLKPASLHSRTCGTFSFLRCLHGCYFQCLLAAQYFLKI